MHFTIVAAGAIGGTVGAHLVRGGHEVLFVDRDRAHVDVMNTAGLTIEGRETFTVRARAVAPEALRGVVRGHVPEAVLLCVKARSEEHTSELQSHHDLVCRLLLEKKKNLVLRTRI